MLSLERKRLVTEEWDNNSASQIRIRSLPMSVCRLIRVPSKQLAPLPSLGCFAANVVSQLARNWRSVNPGLLREPVNPSVWCVHQEVLVFLWDRWGSSFSSAVGGVTFLLFRNSHKSGSVACRARHPTNCPLPTKPTAKLLHCTLRLLRWRRCKNQTHFHFHFLAAVAFEPLFQLLQPATSHIRHSQPLAAKKTPFLCCRHHRLYQSHS
ncbi:hypothetical protein QR685DRAFT_202137 [Neurospora intermedia]|uniref:Uncharacterized protein n=1 Tax=Neurospora intermedia TaxID=5142 RepID=A0ABR3DFE2_NEUIN